VALASQAALFGCVAGENPPPGDDSTDTNTETQRLGVITPWTPDLAGAAFVDDSNESHVPVAEAGACTGKICYHGGAVVTDRPTVYYIWYGDWNPSPVPDLLKTFAETLGNSPYFRINTTYTDSSGNPVTGRMIYGASYSVGYTHTASLGGDDVGQIVTEALQGNHLPYDPNGIYFVMGSRGVHVPGLCTDLCAWHSSERVTFAYGRAGGSVPVLYGFIGNPLYCYDKETPGVCAEQQEGPNGTSGADGMASLLAHEISETVTDPFGNGWHGSAGETENADLCAWTFGTSYYTANGAQANQHLGSLDWLLQRNYNHALGRCTRTISGY
jgi:hypothetical protein